MIKRILVALDIDSDTPVATRYAVEIGKRYNARLTGLSVVDMGSIEATSVGGGIGTMYYADKIRERLTEEAREKARELTEKFSLLASEVDHVELVEEGVPFERIVEDMKFHDILIVGDDPHFFYSHPHSKTDTIAHVVEKTIGPTLVVKKRYRAVKKVLIAFDGTDESARAMRRFLLLKPFGTDQEIVIINVYKDNLEESKFILSMAESYAEAHGFTVSTVSMEDSDPKKAILSQAGSSESDLIVVGVHVKRGLTGKKLGDTTSFLLKHSEVPVFMDH
jgi:nucleotide-binding universal stress UspA family protein